MYNEGLKISNFSVFYGKLEAVHAFALEANAGQAVSLMGGNGAGKTSILKGVMGLVKSSGKLVFRGKSLYQYEPSSLSSIGIGYVPQGRRVFGTLTAEENLQLVGGRKRNKNLIHRTLSLFPELDGHMHQLASTLSGGEQVMLAMARTLVTEPNLLLLDEPTEGLMPQLEIRLARELENALKKNLTVVIAEQNMSFVKRICSRIYFLEEGKTNRVLTVESALS